MTPHKSTWEHNQYTQNNSIDLHFLKKRKEVDLSYQSWLCLPDKVRQQSSIENLQLCSTKPWKCTCSTIPWQEGNLIHRGQSTYWWQVSVNPTAGGMWGDKGGGGEFSYVVLGVKLTLSIYCRVARGLIPPQSKARNWPPVTAVEVISDCKKLVFLPISVSHFFQWGASLNALVPNLPAMDQGSWYHASTYIFSVLFIIWLSRKFYFEKLLGFPHQIRLILDTCQVAR